MEWTSPVNTQLVFLVSIIIPDAVRAVVDDLFVGVMRRCTLQHLQIADEDAFELSSVWSTVVGLAGIVNDHV